MMSALTTGQKEAINQLRAIEREGNGAFQLVSTPRATDSGWLEVKVSLSCAGFVRAAGGLPLREREVFVVCIPADFPFALPVIWTRHARFAEHEHVQWCRHLCLYQASATEWDAKDGMFGFVDRLVEWLARGAMNEFEPEGAPLHPPVAYVGTAADEMVIPRADAPTVVVDTWFGTARLHIVHEKRRDLVSWKPMGASEEREAMTESADQRYLSAAAILLATQMPFEYPAKVAGLLEALTSRGVPRRLLFLTLVHAALEASDGTPLYMVLGAPMRGTSGSSERKQHLSVWRLDTVVADALRLAAAQFSENPKLKAIGEGMEAAILAWAAGAGMNWVPVREARPEVTRRRDEGTAMTWFAGRTVSVWGCGALGAQVAELVVRAGVRKLILRDNGIVAPGVLVRQPFVDADVGKSKAEVLAARVAQIDPNIEVIWQYANVLVHPLGDDDWTDGADLVIDATASASVLEKFERQRAMGNPLSVPVVSMAVDHRGERGVVVTAGAEHSGGPLDVLRRAKLEVCRRPNTRHFADAFWPAADRHPLFQPEPGCSDATFVGSAADLMVLAASMLNCAATYLSAKGKSDTSSAHFLTAAHVELRDQARVWSRTWPPDVVCVDPETAYQIRIGPEAWQDVLAWIARAGRVLGARVETGGVLFGERNDAARVIWVGEVLGPPPDSKSSPTGFLCGTRGVESANREKERRTRGSVAFVGMWHTHPTSAPLPSPTDLHGMATITVAADSRTPKAVLLILGQTATGTPTIAAFLFRREEFAGHDSGAWGDGEEQALAVSDEHGQEAVTYTRVCAVQRAPTLRQSNRVGLALSGGGMRAIAFHLGCLRALNDRGILDQVVVLSTVSGGSVIGALYAYGQRESNSFADFDARVVNLLRSGLLAPLVRRAVASHTALGALATLATAGVAAIVADSVRTALTVLDPIKHEDVVQRVRRIQPPARRWRSRSDALRSALCDELFGATRLSEETRNGVAVVLNATELRTGTAFRFGSERSGSSRFGRLATADVDVALAVAASAAYPALLPAFDLSLPFQRSDGARRTERVLLTDGGVYDNLGTACLESGRTYGQSQHAYDVDYIIACDAGAGVVDGLGIPYWWPTRMTAAFETEFRRVQNETRNRLHSLASSDRLKGFVLSYLGQDDRRLPWAPVDLVSRERVVNYPTNFSAMTTEMIGLLTGRGEQLTRTLLTHYLPEL